MNMNILDKHEAVMRSEAALASDVKNIRVITIDGVRVASVRATKDQTRDLAVAKLLSSSARLKRALEALAAKVDQMAPNVKGTMEYQLATSLLDSLNSTQPGMRDLC